MEEIVISLGGSFLFSDTNQLKKLKEVLTKRKSFRFVIVVGGGKLARDYIDFGSKFGLDEDTLNRIGIKSTEINAFIVSKYLKFQFYNGNPKNIGSGKNIVTCGYKPGWTTDVVSAYAAKALKSKVLFNISKEDGVYDKDPELFKKSKRLKSLTFNELYKIVNNERHPGMNFIFDPDAAKICEKNKIKVIVTNKINDISNYIDGKEVAGSTIS